MRTRGDLPSGSGQASDVVGGMATSMAAAFANNADGSLKASLGSEWSALKAISSGMAHMRSDAIEVGVAAGTMQSEAHDLQLQSLQLHTDVDHFLTAMTKTSDRRNAKRRDLAYQISIRSGTHEDNSARLINISESGATFIPAARCAAVTR